MGNWKYVNYKLHNWTRSKVLTKVAPKERAHKGLESASLTIEICFREINTLEITDHNASFGRIETYIILEDFGVLFAAFFIKCLQAFQKLTFGFIFVVLSENLEVVRCAWLTEFPFVPEFTEDKFVMFVESL